MEHLMDSKQEVSTASVEDKQEDVEAVIKQVAESKRVEPKPKEDEGSLKDKDTTNAGLWMSNKLLSDQNRRLIAENEKLKRELETLTHANAQIVHQTETKVETEIKTKIVKPELDRMLNSGWQVFHKEFSGVDFHVVFIRNVSEVDLSQVGKSERPTLSTANSMPGVMIRQNLGERIAARKLVDNTEVDRVMYPHLYSDAG